MCSVVQILKSRAQNLLILQTLQNTGQQGRRSARISFSKTFHMLQTTQSILRDQSQAILNPIN